MKLEKSRSLWDGGATLAQVFWATNSLAQKEQISCIDHGDPRPHVEGPRELRANFNGFSQTKVKCLLLVTYLMPCGMSDMVFWVLEP